jgi:hypothetical protein
MPGELGKKYTLVKHTHWRETHAGGDLVGRGEEREEEKRQGVPELTSVIVRGHDSSTVDGNSGELRFGAVSHGPQCRELYFREGEERGREGGGAVSIPSCQKGETSAASCSAQAPNIARWCGHMGMKPPFGAVESPFYLREPHRGAPSW